MCDWISDVCSSDLWTHYLRGVFDFGSVRKMQGERDCFTFLDCPLKGHQHDVVTARLHLEAAPGGNFDRTRGSHFHNGAVLDGFVHLDHSRYGARQAGQRHGMIAGVNDSNEGGWWSGGAN